jgi:hypothetical protein
MIYKLGSKFGRLTLVAKHRIKGKTKWECVCECGNTTLTEGNDIVRGKTSSCGCLRREVTGDMFRTHGLHGHDHTYYIWKSMRQRINNTNNKDYRHYGGRGIKICEEWSSYINFLKDMGPCPEGYSIERVDVNGNYCQSNCIWIPRADQPKNTRRTITNGKPRNTG